MLGRAGPRSPIKPIQTGQLPAFDSRGCPPRIVRGRQRSGERHTEGRDPHEAPGRVPWMRNVSGVTWELGPLMAHGSDVARSETNQQAGMARARTRWWLPVSNGRGLERSGCAYEFALSFDRLRSGPALPVSARRTPGPPGQPAGVAMSVESANWSMPPMSGSERRRRSSIRAMQASTNRAAPITRNGRL